MDKNVGLKCSKTFCQGYGTFCQKTRIPHAVQTQNVCDVCAFASNTCTRTSNNIYYTPFGYVFQCKIDELLHFLDIEIAETEKKKDTEFQISIANSEPFETQIKKRQEKGSVSRETELKKKILSCAAESVPFVEQKNQNISVGALLQKRTKPDAVPAQR